MKEKSHLPAFASLLICLFITIEQKTIAATPTLRIMSLGDSITAGYTDNPWWNVEFDFSYRIGLYKRLTNAGYSFQFVGSSPEPLDGQYGLPQFIGTPDLRDLGQDHHRGYAWLTGNIVTPQIAQWMSEDKANVILLMIGNVDMQFVTDSDITVPKKHLADLVQKIVTTWPRVHLVIAQMSPFAWYEENVVQYNNYIKTELVPSYFNRGKRVTTVNQYDNFLFPKGTLQNIDASLFANGSHHPTPLGYDRMAQTWFENIQAIFPLTTPSIAAPPVLMPNGHFHVRYLGSPNSIYQIDRATVLTGPWEIGFMNVTADDNGVFEIDDPNPGAEPERFYRIDDPYQ
jgi:hypothetical protein